MRDVADDLGWGDAFEDSDASDAGAESDASASDDDGRTATATTTTTRDAAASRIASAQATTATTTREGARVGTIGPELAALRAAQGETREHYTMSHYDRLYGCERRWRRDARGSKTWCKDVHDAGCRECTTCHFCRQKTTDAKTTCVCGTWRRAPEGGRGRGTWCGWCLEMRVGENLDEAMADAEWRCPVCRDICNCSGANCLRAKRNLFPTQQLTGEALAYGWPSVAHYLITTAIVSGRDAPPMLDLPAAYTERQRRQRDPAAAGGGGGSGRGTIPGLFGARSNKEAQAIALRAKVAASVRAAFGDLVTDGDRGADGDDEGDQSDGAAEAAETGSNARRRGGRSRARGTRGARVGAQQLDGYGSSDGSELNSSDSEGDVETATTPDVVARDAEPVDVAMVAAPPRSDHVTGHVRSYAATSTAREGSVAQRVPKQKRARTDYGPAPDRREDEEWRSDDEGASGADFVHVPREQRHVVDAVHEDDGDRIERRTREPSTSRPGVATHTTEYGETVVVRQGDVAPPTARRRRRRRVPRPTEAEQFATVNPEVVEAAQSRAVHAAAQEEDEETRAAQGEGACAQILRDLRDGARDEFQFRDALVCSNQALRGAMVETDSGIVVDESELRAFCALVVRIARVAPRTPAGLQIISDARETLADPETFRAHQSTARAVVLRALLRCSDHAAYQGVHVGESLIQLLTLLAELGQEYCMIREYIQAKSGETPPELPTYIQASIHELAAVDAEGENQTTKDDQVALLLLERLEAAHVLLYASMAALRRSVRGPPLAGREELFCPTLAAFLDPSYPFKVKLRKQALRLIAAAVTAATRDWGDPKSPETLALAKNASEHIWPALSNLLALDFPARSNSPVTTVGGSGVTRAAIEGSARLIALLLRSGVWTWSQAETAVVAPHTPATFWRLAGAPYRAFAYRLYSRLLDVTPIYYGGIGAPLLKLWVLATMDPAAGESGATGISRARARITRAAKRHPILFPAFPASEKLEGCDKSDNASLHKRARWVAEVLHQAATTAVSPKVRVSAVAASNAFWDALPCREAEVRGKHSESAFMGASALILTTAVSHLSDAFLAPPPPKLVPMLCKTVELSSTRGGRQSEARAETLAHAMLTVALKFDPRDVTMLTTLVAILHETMERPRATDADDAIGAIWAALDATDSLHVSLGIASEKVVALREFVITSCAKRSIERARYTASSKAGTQAAKGWALALALLTKKSSEATWLRALMPSILDALQPPAVAIGKSAAPPPISTSDTSIRAALYRLLIDAVTHHPDLTARVDGDVVASTEPENVFFIAIMRAAIGEIAYALGGAEQSKGFMPLSEMDRNAAGRRLRGVLGATPSATTHALEEVYRSFKPPVETLADARETDVEQASPTATAVAALKFISAFAISTPAATRLVKTHVLSPIKAAMKRKESHARRALVSHVNDLWAGVGLIQHSSKENAVPLSAPPTPAAKRLEIPQAAWPAGAAEPCAFASIASKPPGTSINVIGQLIKREPANGVAVKENPKTGKKFDMLFVTLCDHAGDELRVQLIGASAKKCAAALDVDGMPSDIPLGFVGLKAKGAMAWDPKETASLVVNPATA